MPSGSYVDPQTIHNPATGTAPPASWGDTVRDDLQYLYSRGPYVCTSSTRPASPTEGDIIYETDTNRAWRYNGSAWRWMHGTVPQCRVTRTSAFSLANAANTVLTFATANITEVADTDSIHNGTTNTSRFTVPSAFPGLWSIGYWFTFSSNATGTRGAWFELNQNGVSGSGRYAQMEVAANGGGNTTLNGFCELGLSAGDYIELFAFQNSGGALNTFGTNSGDMIVMRYIGPID